MKSRDPDFYLISSEGYGLESPRRCWRLKPLRLATRDDLLLVRVEPAVIYRDRNGIEFQLGQIALAARHVGYSISSINEWPFYVHVAKLNRADVPVDGFLNADDVETIAWAELYPTEETANAG